MASHLLGRELEGDERRSDGMLARLVISGFLAMGVMVFSLSLYGMQGEVREETAVALRGLFRMGAMALSFPIFFLLGLPLFDAVIGMRRWLSSDAFILLGMGAALLVSTWNTFMDGEHVYFETATMVLVLVAAGRWMDARARERAREHLVLLAGSAQPLATRVEGAAEAEIPVDQLRVGDIVLVRAGERIPVDGIVRAGRSFLDQSELTGEAQPKSVDVGDLVLAGALCEDGCLRVQAQAVLGARVRDDIERVLELSIGKRADIVCLSDRLARFFLPLVSAVAACTVLAHWNTAGPQQALEHGLTVFLIACPCALGLATPLAFWVALGEAWSRGILVQGGEVLERLARTKQVFFDKTGTLTSGGMQLIRVELAEGVDKGHALALAVALEEGSQHPIARGLRSAWRARPGILDCATGIEVRDFRALPGIGVEASLDGKRHSLTRSQGSGCLAAEKALTRVMLRAEGKLLAEFSLLAEVRPEAREVVTRLASMGFAPIGLTGDMAAAARVVADHLQMPIESELLPVAKAERVQAAGPAGTLFIGDGLNDAVALAAADVGIAIKGSSGKVLQTASVSLLRDDLRSIPELIELAQRAVGIAKLNLIWAFSYNLIGLGLAASGRLTPIMAAIAMVLSSTSVVLNSCRLRRKTTLEQAPREVLQRQATC